MEIEKLPTIISAMQNDICELKKSNKELALRIENRQDEKEDSLSGKVRLRFKSGEEHTIEQIGNKICDIDNIDGIIIPILDGREFLIYPKYKECPLLKDERIKSWKAKSMTEIESLYAKCDGEQETDDLKAIGSPAAMWVRNVAVHRKFNIPGDVLVAIAVIRHLDEINAIAEHIEGADKLNKNSVVWSCSRYGSNGGWYAYGGSGYAAGGNLSDSCLAVSLVLYKKA